MFEKNNQFSLWPNWRRGTPPPEKEAPEEKQKTKEEKAQENIDRTIKDIYRKIDESKARLEQEKARREVDQKLPKERQEEDESPSFETYDYKKRQYKD